MYISFTGYLPTWMYEKEREVIEEKTSRKRNNDTAYIARVVNSKFIVLEKKYTKQPETAFASFVLLPSELYELVQKAYERGEVRGYSPPASEKNI